MSNLNQTVEQKITPFMTKLNANKVIKSIISGMMATMPLSLGTALIAIIAGFPIPAWTNWLTTTGISAHMSAVAGGTTELLSLFMVFTIAYNYAKLKGANGMTAAVLSLGSFIILMPQKIKLTDGTTVDALAKTYIGSGGIFVAILTAILVTALYCYLEKKGLVIKLPESVPEMVSQSLSPAFIAIIIFTLVFLIRVGISYTGFESIFNLIQTVLGKPLMGFGTSPAAVLAVNVIANLIWFFGIHPSTVVTAFIPVFMGALMGNIEAFQAGQPLPYLAYSVLTFGFMTLGGAGGTIGLSINMALFSKSKRFKALGKLAIIPSICNINEPLIFGTPIIFNPIFFIPMVFSSVVSGLVGILFLNIGAFAKFNPLIQLPNTVPSPITIFASSGIIGAIAVCCAILVLTLIYYPFFKFADKQALKEEEKGEIVA